MRLGFVNELGKSSHVLADFRHPPSRCVAPLDRQLHDIGWGLLLMLAGMMWLVPAERVPEGVVFPGYESWCVKGSIRCTYRSRWIHW